MNRTRIYTAWILAFTILLLSSFTIDMPTVDTPAATSPNSVTEEISIALPVSEERTPVNSVSIDDKVEDPAPKYKLVEENGVIYCYNEDGTHFSGGLKELVGENSTDYYYFLGNGQAFNSGYKTVIMGDSAYYYFFEENGKAFTGGLKEVSFDSQSYSYYFGEDGKAVTSSWVTHNGTKYYFQANGRAVQDTFAVIHEHRYYFDEKGRVVIGWFCVDDSYYYADENGVLATNTIVGNYRLDENGKSRTKYQILEYVNELTDESMTDQEKIDALYHWLLTSDIYYFNSYEHIKTGWNWPAGWIDVFAANMMNNQRGNCFKYAAFLSLMIREATGLPVIIYHGRLPLGDPHGWVTVYQDGAWYVYDVQQAIQGEPSSVCYKAPYPLARLIDGVGTVLQ